VANIAAVYRERAGLTCAKIARRRNFRAAVLADISQTNRHYVIQTIDFNNISIFKRQSEDISCAIAPDELSKDIS
jgi:hypothetical protein